MRKMIAYELKKSAVPLLCLTLVCLAVYLIPLATSDHLYQGGASRSYVWVISTVGALLAACVPFGVFDYKMKKRSVDLYYALPMSHTKILTVKFIVGLIAVAVPYTVAYWLGALVAMARAWDKMYAVYYIPQYFASLLPVYVMYAISSFFFTRANKKSDGILFAVFGVFAAGMVFSVLQLLTSQTVSTGTDPNSGTEIFRLHASILSVYYYPFAPLDWITTHFQQHLAQYLNVHYLNDSQTETVNIAVGFTITFVTAAGATAGLFLLEPTYKAEQAEQISDSFFGYRVMIPLFTVCLLANCDTMEYLLAPLLIAASFLLTVVYRRTAKIGIKQTTVFLLSIGVGLTLMFLL